VFSKVQHQMMAIKNIPDDVPDVWYTTNARMLFKLESLESREASTVIPTEPDALETHLNSHHDFITYPGFYFLFSFGTLI
jgi:hypothetical protein